MYPQNNNFQLSAVDENGKPKLLFLVVIFLFLVIFAVVGYNIVILSPLYDYYVDLRGGGWAGLDILVIWPALLMLIYILISKMILKQTILATFISFFIFLGIFILLHILLSSLLMYTFIEDVWNDSNLNLIILSVVGLYYLIGLPAYIIGTYVGYKYFPPENYTNY